ncbi:MAG TPA: AAA family ATPase [Candidatus Merdenecus merdavium]|nr:AAA family ATPase [Candidatus Merdenecus merdavium]
MDNSQTDLLEILDHIDPSNLNYQDWVNVGMALKHEGYAASVWDSWSRNDSRYHSGECFKKWESFHGAGSPVTAGTVVQMAKNQGWVPERDQGHELDWNDSIDKELVVVDKNWVEGQEVKQPSSWNPVEQLIKYLEILFESTENVGYVTGSWEKDGKYLPNKGNWDRTAGELIQQLNACDNDIGSILGDYKEEAGAWIRFNPLDGKGCKNDNVTDFRYALVESDTMEIEKQNAILRELELPIACLVHSGGKSLHAIVRIDAVDYNEYRKRVDYLYNVCQKNGLKIDSQNRNPSRLSRMPGIIRNGQKQFLVDVNIGKESWAEWNEWIESIHDDLPDPESLEDYFNNLPELSPPLINNLLRQGHKMLIAGPSKAGKSFALIELCCAIAEGRKWLNWDCEKGKVMYVNLELDRASCLHRFKDVYQALGWAPNNLSNIDIWNLRGKSVPMDKLAPKLIRRAAKKNYMAIIIDPIYKIITGDENSADQMAHFCNQFDKVCTELGSAVIYCHHHSKGSQGGKRSMDRASGSGVFARDPDALMDLIELDLNDDILRQEENKAICEVCTQYLNHNYDDWEDDISQDTMCSYIAMLDYCRKKLSKAQFIELNTLVEQRSVSAKNKTAWRIEGTLREFPKFAPVNLWFDYPMHHLDKVGSLKDIQTGDNKPSWQKNFTKKKTPEDRKKERKLALETAYEACGIDGNVTIQALAEFMGITEKTVRSRIKEHGGYWIDESTVGKK